MEGGTTRWGKDTKIPLRVVDYRRTDATVSENWDAFSNAVTAMENAPFPCGLGFVITKSDGLLFLDIDKIDDDEKYQEAYAIVEALGSFTEISHSGEGLHVIGFGTKSVSRVRKGHFELYDDTRFIALTGEVCEGFEEVRDLPEQALRDLEIKIFGEPEQKETSNLPVPTGKPGENLPSDDDVLCSAWAMDSALFEALHERGDISAFSSDASVADFSAHSVDT